MQDLALGIMRLVGGACAVLGGLLLAAGLVARLLVVSTLVNFTSGHWLDLVFAAVGLVLLVLGYVVSRAGDLVAEQPQRDRPRDRGTL